MSKANQKQVGGVHYKSGFQHWDWITALKLSYLFGCATKYLIRWKKKNGFEDLVKARHYLEKIREAEETKQVEARRLTDTFLTENEVPGPEATVIHALVNYHLGDLNQLKAAETALTFLINTEEEDEAEKRAAS